MPEARFLKIIIVVLLLINTGTLAFLWIGRPQQHGGQHGHGGPPPPPGGAAALIKERLQLSDAQEATYKKLREVHHATVTSIREDLKGYEKQLYALLASPDSAAASVQQTRWLDSLAAGQRRIEQITYRHFGEVRAICTPEQQRQLDEVVGEALERMR